MHLRFLLYVSHDTFLPPEKKLTEKLLLCSFLASVEYSPHYEKQKSTATLASRTHTLLIYLQKKLSERSAVVQKTTPDLQDNCFRRFPNFQ